MILHKRTKKEGSCLVLGDPSDVCPFMNIILSFCKKKASLSAGFQQTWQSFSSAEKPTFASSRSQIQNDSFPTPIEKIQCRLLC